MSSGSPFEAAIGFAREGSSRAASASPHHLLEAAAAPRWKVEVEAEAQLGD